MRNDGLKNRYSTVEVSERKYSQPSMAPNRSAGGTDYYTVVTSKQTWHFPVKIYGGLSYRIIETYISNRPNTRGQMISRSSQPWIEGCGAAGQGG